MRVKEIRKNYWLWRGGTLLLGS
uniref:Truncated envelope glycoprotein n=1 Tax=Human immunodeficiency virus type 1 TaxID=11676 RepID=Q9IJZ2_HV1|nr:truncated envelope glycoprotein [Human immunodeficiency virus 1]